MNRSLNGFRCIGFAYKNHRDLFENESADGDCGPWAVGGERDVCIQYSVAGSREMGSIVRGANGSMLAVASRSIACFALLEYRFAVEDGRG